MYYTATTRETPPPEAAGAQYFAMTPVEEVGAPAASRPAPMEEVRPQGYGVRHCGSGCELVLDATVPHLGAEDEQLITLNAELLREFLEWSRETRVNVRELLEVPAARDQGGGGGQEIAQEIPEVQVPRRRRVQQRTDAPLLQVPPQERTSERIVEHIVDARESTGIPQERISERIVEHIVPVPHSIPQKRISERIVEQNVDESVQPIPQERTSERNVEQIVSAPQVIPQKRTSKRIAEQIVDTGMGTSSSSAATLGDAECPKYGFFALFPKNQKVRRSAGSRLPESSGSPAHGHRRLMPSPWSLRWWRQYWRWIPRTRTLTAGGMSLAACG